MGGRQRILDGRYLILPPYKSQKLVLEIEAVNVGRGGELSVVRPPRPRYSEFKGAVGKRADQPGRVTPVRPKEKKVKK
jgi:hypothetical protein